MCRPSGYTRCPHRAASAARSSPAATPHPGTNPFPLNPSARWCPYHARHVRGQSRFAQSSTPACASRLIAHLVSVAVSSWAAPDPASRCSCRPSTAPPSQPPDWILLLLPRAREQAPLPPHCALPHRPPWNLSWPSAPQERNLLHYLSDSSSQCHSP